MEDEGEPLGMPSCLVAFAVRFREGKIFPSTFILRLFNSDPDFMVHEKHPHYNWVGFQFSTFSTSVNFAS